MRVLIISPTQSGIGGIAQHVQGLDKFLKKNNHTVDIISSENTPTLPIKGLKNPSFMVSSFVKTKFGKKYDIVNAQNIPSALAMKNVSAKKVLSLWGVYSNQIGMLYGSSLERFSEKFEKNALSWADAITVASKEIHTHYTKLGYKAHYIPNAVDLDSLPAGTDRRYQKQLIYAGRLSKEKGILDLLEAAKKMQSDIHLIILGSGPEEQKVRDASEDHPNIHYLGYQPKAVTIPLIRGSDLLIQPSLMEGGLNTTLLEAMACKTPMVVTSLDVYSDAIRHGETAHCVEPGSPQRLADGIREILNDEERRKALAARAYDEVQGYSWEKVIMQYIAIYSDLLQNR